MWTDPSTYLFRQSMSPFCTRSVTKVLSVDVARPSRTCLRTCWFVIISRSRVFAVCAYAKFRSRWRNPLSSCSRTKSTSMRSMTNFVFSTRTSRHLATASSSSSACRTTQPTVSSLLKAFGVRGLRKLKHSVSAASICSDPRSARTQHLAPSLPYRPSRRALPRR